jgi:hypothetical protein
MACLGLHLAQSDKVPDVCGSCHVCVLWKEQKKRKTTKTFLEDGLVWSCVPCLLQVSLCVCLGLTQLIQCREYRFAVKVSTCNNLPSKIIIMALTSKETRSRLHTVYSCTKHWVCLCDAARQLMTSVKAMLAGWLAHE